MTRQLWRAVSRGDTQARPPPLSDNEVSARVATTISKGSRLALPSLQPLTAAGTRLSTSSVTWSSSRSTVRRTLRPVFRGGQGASIDS